jgi:hypothetical protein
MLNEEENLMIRDRGLGAANITTPYILYNIDPTTRPILIGLQIKLNFLLAVGVIVITYKTRQDSTRCCNLL